MNRSSAPAGMASSTRARRMPLCRRASRLGAGRRQKPADEGRREISTSDERSRGLDPKEDDDHLRHPPKVAREGGVAPGQAESGIWKEVRVYDSATLEEWLEQSPAVNAWLAGILGKKPPGLSHHRRLLGEPPGDDGPKPRTRGVPGLARGRDRKAEGLAR